MVNYLDGSTLYEIAKLLNTYPTDLVATIWCKQQSHCDKFKDFFTKALKDYTFFEGKKKYVFKNNKTNSYINIQRADGIDCNFERTNIVIFDCTYNFCDVVELLLPANNRHGGININYAFTKNDIELIKKELEELE